MTLPNKSGFRWLRTSVYNCEFKTKYKCLNNHIIDDIDDTDEPSQEEDNLHEEEQVDENETSTEDSTESDSQNESKTGDIAEEVDSNLNEEQTDDDS